MKRAGAAGPTNVYVGDEKRVPRTPEKGRTMWLLHPKYLAGLCFLELELPALPFPTRGATNFANHGGSEAMLG